MSAAGTAELLQAVRTRLLTFVPRDGSPSLATVLTGGLWLDEAPDTVTTPFGVLRLLQTPTEGDALVRKLVLVELLLYGRPSAQRPTIQRAADVAEQALWKWTDTGVGELVMTGTTVQWLPPFAAPADRELIGCRLTATAYVYLPMLTQYTV
jgi:hypothetical protein